MFFDPERPAEPIEKEPRLWDYCVCCGSGIYGGDLCYENPMKPDTYFCAVCYDSMDEVIAGDEY